MVGNTRNARHWTNADVYIYFHEGNENSIYYPLRLDKDISEWKGWEPFGLLEGAAGLEEDRKESAKEHYAWGNILVATVKSKHKRSLKVTVIEDNPITFRLINPGSIIDETEKKYPIDPDPDDPGRKIGIVKGYLEECKPELDGNILNVGDGKIKIQIDDKIRTIKVNDIPGQGIHYVEGWETQWAYLTVNNELKATLVVTNEEIDEGHIPLCKILINNEDIITDFEDLRQFFVERKRLPNPGRPQEDRTISYLQKRRIIKNPQYEYFALTLETRDGTVIRRRVIPLCSIATVGNVKEGEEDIVTTQLTINYHARTRRNIIYYDYETDLADLIGGLKEEEPIEDPGLPDPWLNPPKKDPEKEPKDDDPKENPIGEGSCKLA